MIQFAHALPAGNATRLLFEVGGARPWRLVRKFDSAPSAVDDGDLLDEDSGPGEWSHVDWNGLSNGREVHYALFAFVDSDWVLDGTTRAVTPQYIQEPLYASPDFVGFIRQRLEDGLACEVAANTLRHASGFIPVLTAYPQIESVRMPVVTAVLKDRRAEVRGVGEYLAEDTLQGSVWSEYAGWLDRSTLEIVVWALSHGDRVRLRDAVQRVIMLNLPVLQFEGYLTPEITESDTQDFESYKAPIFQTIFNLSAVHPTLVRSEYGSIDSVETEVTPYAGVISDAA